MASLILGVVGCCAARDSKVSQNEKVVTGNDRTTKFNQKPTPTNRDTAANTVSAKEAAAQAAEKRYNDNLAKQKESSQRLKDLKLKLRSDKGIDLK